MRDFEGCAGKKAAAILENGQDVFTLAHFPRDALAGVVRQGVGHLVAQDGLELARETLH